jgi:hypothetical protein
MAMGHEVVGYEGSMPEARTLAGLWLWLELAGVRRGEGDRREERRGRRPDAPLVLFPLNDREIANTSSTK